MLRDRAPRRTVRFRLSGHFVNGAVSRNTHECAAPILVPFCAARHQGSIPRAPTLLLPPAASSPFLQPKLKDASPARPAGFVVPTILLATSRFNRSYNVKTSEYGDDHDGQKLVENRVFTHLPAIDLLVKASSGDSEKFSFHTELKSSECLLRCTLRLQITLLSARALAPNGWEKGHGKVFLEIKLQGERVWPLSR